MNTLTTLYGSSPELTDNPNLNKLLFATAFPENTQEKADELKQRSEKIIVPVLEAWRVRLATALSDGFESTKDPEDVLRDTPWMTKEEAQAIMAAIDEFMPGEEPAIAVLRAREFTTYMEQCLRVAKNLSYEIYEGVQARKNIIISPNGPNHKPGTIITT